MARRMEESDPLLYPAASRREIQPSLPSPIPELEGPRSLLKQLSCLPCNVCVKSKAAMLILVWSIMVGGFYLGLLISFWGFGLFWQNYSRQHHNFTATVNLVIYTLLAAYAFLALLLLLYPISGYLADIYCGRYKAVTLSVVFLWVAMVFLSVAAVMGIIKKFVKFEDLKIPFGLFTVIGLILIIIGLAGYQANIVQLGLDQLLEAPSEKLGLFVHWLMWAYNLGGIFMIAIFVSLPCYIDVGVIKDKFIHVLGSTPFLCLAVLSLLLVFTCYNHGWFYSEPGQHNPYKTVFRVLNFARKNKYPLRRSAFTYCDDIRPSRIDFAKDRFGGPFTTSQVEDVKTFLRIVVVLLALGPVFVLEIPGSYYLFPLFALHVGKKLQFRDKKPCRSPVDWALLQSGGLGCVVSTLFLPVYIWVIFSLLRKRVPRILNRLWCSMVMSLAGVLCLLMIDLIGHLQYHHHHSTSGTPHHQNSTCLFTSNYLYTGHKDQPPLMPVVLNIHKGAIIAPTIMLNVGYLLIQATSFEFISAQSPHSMKGLLVGVFFAIKGLFQFISAAAVVPFAIPGIWNSINPVTNCAFGYYLLNIVVALTGLVIFTIVIRRYRYRQRDERPYDPRFVEQYYERYIGIASQSSTNGMIYSSSDERMYHEELGHTCSDSSSDVSSLGRGGYGHSAGSAEKDKKQFYR